MLEAKDLLHLIEKLSESPALAKGKARVVLYGVPAGWLPKVLAVLHCLPGIEVPFLIDRRAEEAPYASGGIEVHPPSRLAARDYDHVMVLSKSRRSIGEIRTVLDSFGLQRNSDYFDFDGESQPEFVWNPATIGPLATRFYEWDYEVSRHTAHLPQYYPKGAVARLLRIASEEGLNFEGLTAFEIGYGPSLIVPVILCLMGAQKVYACDYLKIPYGSEGLSYENLPAPFRRLCSLVHEEPSYLKIFGCGSYNAFFNKLGDIARFDLDRNCYEVNPDRIRVLNGDEGNLQHLAMPDAQVDFAYSNGVLEHVEDLDAAFAELARVTRPGGRGWHIITSAMHWPFPGWDGDPAQEPLAFLQWSPETYDRLQTGHWGYERPYRLPDYEAAWARQGFTFRVSEVERARQDQLPARVDEYFQRYSKEDLLCTGATFWTRRG